jgi:D-serine dehydratase
VQAIKGFLADLMQLVHQADAEGLFEDEQILISAGGSAYFDLVGTAFQQEVNLSRKLLPVLRSGCYITHDHGFYDGLLHDMQHRNAALPGDGLRPALEIWSMVQSRPEPDLAILTMGKRDASYDIDLPFPLAAHRVGAPGLPAALPAGCVVEKMNDQHAYLRLPKGDAICSTLQVGDLVSCGISHPCTSFDKWQVMLVVDDQYQVLSAINTMF